MIKVMVFGTFDGVHDGHRDFFAQAKTYGDYLIVVVARDVNVKKIKGAKPKFHENARLKEVQGSKNVDKAILGYKIDRYKIIKEHRPDVICLGYDQRVDFTELKKKIQEFGLVAKLQRLEPYQAEKFKSSLLK